MTNSYYQKLKEKPGKEACKRYQNLSEEEKEIGQKKTRERNQNLTGED